ncbi:serine protease [Albimonas sp. CAU 1670]|uniref:serine protease n=1 Tax=Albimonas sp. CAU 1670 TaxID=3032599 RepID=UPI0023D9B52B|nr:serine protease [Albimonas sp. CAU 1670]MDF2235765.1 serine protease [Albimonas sp. CAU 1670]
MLGIAMRACLLLLAVAVIPLGFASRSQAAGWVQIASEPNIRSATARAAAFASTHRDVRVYATTSGWFAIVLGPPGITNPEDALARFKSSGMVPGDSFVTDGHTYLREVWSSGSALTDMALVDAVKRESMWSERTRMGVQNALIWSGDYRGRIDGDFGRLTREAIMAFQSKLGDAPSGYLTEPQIAELEARRVAAQQRAGYRVVDDYQTGIRVGMAENLLRREAQDGVLVPFSSFDGHAFMMLLSMQGGSASLASLYDTTLEIAAEIPGQAEVYKPLRDDWFVVSKSGFTQSLYAYVRLEYGAAKGFILQWDNDAAQTYGPIATAMFNDFGTIAGVVLDPNAPTVASASASPRRTPQPPVQDEPPSAASSGTGFFVTRQGHVLTNRHVIESCSSITVADVPATVVAWDEDLDLALLQTSNGSSPSQIAKFAPRPARLNADVTALGYPLHGLLGGLNVTRGVVSSLSGVLGDRNVIQISAEVQPGNSGGPLLDAQGAVVGVVVAKLDALAVAQISGDLPQNVNFAIRGELAKAFLSRNMADFEIEMSMHPRSPSDLAEAASSFTALIECFPV